MKRIIIILGVISLFVFEMVGQGNLQFSKVVFIELEGISSIASGVDIVDSTNLIVPTGKVVKIESASVGRQAIGNGNFFGNYDVGVYLNGKIITPLNRDGAYPLPIWLKEGIYSIKLQGSYSSFISKGFISGIEFNVTPP